MGPPRSRFVAGEGPGRSHATPNAASPARAGPVPGEGERSGHPEPEDLPLVGLRALAIWGAASEADAPPARPDSPRTPPAMGPTGSVPRGRSARFGAGSAAVILSRRRARGRCAAAAAVALAATVHAAHASEPTPFADRVIWGHASGLPTYDSAGDHPLTFGPFGPCSLWADPAATLGPPNTLDDDDTAGVALACTFTPLPMRRVHLAWPAWRYGMQEPTLLGEVFPFAGRGRLNGLTLAPGAQLVVQFDEPVENNPPDDAAPGGPFHWGVDLLVHGNGFFLADGFVTSDTPLDAATLTGDVLAEPLSIAVAQSAAGPWFTADVTADGLFPTQPWAWDADAQALTDAPQSFTKPVNPALTAADFAGLTIAQAVERYAGSAGGAGVDLDRLIDESGMPASLPWIAFVRVRADRGESGEVCAFVDVAPGPPAPVCPADFNGDTSPGDIFDLFDFLAALDGGLDFNADTSPADIFDLFDFLAVLDTPCP